MDGWDDLFAAAAGGGAAAPPPTAAGKRRADDGEPKKKKKKKKQVGKGASPGGGFPEFVQHLASLRSHLVSLLSPSPPSSPAAPYDEALPRLLRSSLPHPQNTPAHPLLSALLLLLPPPRDPPARLSLLAAADELYYTLYHHLLSLLPPRTITRDFSSLLSVPSPPHYFGGAPDSALAKTDPLAALHALHISESLLLLPSLSPPSSYVRAAKKAAALPPSPDVFSDAHHEVPLPLEVARYKDVHRRWPCHVYGYASWDGLDLGDFAEEFVDFGAGTGYLSNSLKLASLHITALDVSPPSASTLNEYHGSVSSHCAVARGVVKDIPAPTAGKRTALVLCYPCPDKDMGAAAAKRFLALGGQVVVHVGEHGGVTGTRELERVLAGMEMLGGTDCRRWGSDCARVEVFGRRGAREAGYEKDRGARGLLMCGGCGKEGGYRCRFARELVYCGEACWEGGRAERRERMRQVALPAGLEERMEWGDRWAVVDVEKMGARR